MFERGTISNLGKKGNVWKVLAKTVTIYSSLDDERYPTNQKQIKRNRHIQIKHDDFH